MIFIKQLGIYVHIPFCATKCPYCDFYSRRYSKDLEQQYVQKIIWDIARWKNRGYTANTLYFGGGTPNLISPHSIGAIINATKASFNLSGEITIESNPRLITNEKMQILRDYGVNRVSIGMQSANQTELQALGRSHNFKDIQNSIDIIKNVGISNISLDMMLATPYQTIDTVTDTIDKINTLDVTHISAYILKIEENTPFYTDPIIQNCPNDELTQQIYLHSVKKLESIGFNQYEISNFSKDGFESVHNLKYWHADSYLGFGSAAHTFFNGKRYCYSNYIDQYINSPKWICTDNTCDKLTEYILLNLRLVQGIDLNYMHEQFSIPPESMMKIASPLIAHNLMKFINNKLSLTPKGFLVSNSIIEKFI